MGFSKIGGFFLDITNKFGSSHDIQVDDFKIDFDLHGKLEETQRFLTQPFGSQLSRASQVEPSSVCG